MKKIFFSRDRKRPKYHHPARLAHRLPVQANNIGSMRISGNMPRGYPGEQAPRGRGPPRYAGEQVPPRGRGPPRYAWEGPPRYTEERRIPPRGRGPPRYTGEQIPRRYVGDGRESNFCPPQHRYDSPNRYSAPVQPQKQRFHSAPPIARPRHERPYGRVPPRPSHGFSSFHDVPRDSPPRPPLYSRSSMPERPDQSRPIERRRYQATERRQSADDIKKAHHFNNRRQFFDFVQEKGNVQNNQQAIRREDSIPPATVLREDSIPIAETKPPPDKSTEEEKAPPREKKKPRLFGQIPKKNAAPTPSTHTLAESIPPIILSPPKNGVKSRLGWGQGLGIEEEQRAEETKKKQDIQKEAVPSPEILQRPKRLAPVAVATAAYGAACDAALVAKSVAQNVIQIFEGTRAANAADRALASLAANQATRAQCQAYDNLPSALFSIEQSIRTIEDVLWLTKQHGQNMLTECLESPQNEWSRALLAQKVKSCNYSRGQASVSKPSPPNKLTACTLHAIERLRGGDTSKSISRWISSESPLAAPSRTLRRRPSQTYYVASRGGHAVSSTTRKAQIEHGRIHDLPTCDCPPITASIKQEDPSSASDEYWTDIEKLIFLDKFLLYPKNFVRIASYLRRKRPRDCVRFYYDTKYHVDYKSLLREHQQRRRGKAIWDSTGRAVQVFGGDLRFDPIQNSVSFSLPVSDHIVTPLPSRKIHQTSTSLNDNNSGPPQDVHT